MAEKLLGVGFDIHGGGSDLVFPHHENEAAQTAAARGAQLARLWMHNGMVRLEGEKMAKSVGNICLLHEALAAHGRDALIALLLRRPLPPADRLLARSALGEAARSVERIRDAGPAARRRRLAGGAGAAARGVLRRARRRLQHAESAGGGVRVGARGEPPQRGGRGGRRRRPARDARRASRSRALLDADAAAGRPDAAAQALLDAARGGARRDATSPRPTACATSSAALGWEVRDSARTARRCVPARVP